MRGRRQILLLLAIMMVVAITVGGIVLFILYKASFAEQRGDLVEIARQQAHLFNAIARFDAKYSTQDVPGGAFAATLQQIRDAQTTAGGIGKTGEFILAKREGDQIVFLLPHRHIDFPYPDSVPVSAEPTEPIRRALAGESGTLVYRGFRGKLVLAAYEPVKELDSAVVAKMDIAEIRAPFIEAGLMATVAGFFLIFTGSILFLRIGNPLVQRLEENELKYRSMFESAADSVLLVNPDGAILDANPAACSAYGFSREEFVDRSVDEIVHPDHLPLVKQSYKLVLEGKKFRRESIHIRKDGAAIPAEVQLSPIMHKGQAAILVAARDITDRKEAEQALRESEMRYRNLSESLEKKVETKIAELRQAESLAAIGRLVSVVAHEIRNPLQNIHMGIDALKKEIKQNGDKREMIEEIEYGIGLLNNIVNELLNYARPLRLQYSSTPVGEIVARALKMLTPRMQNIDISVELEQKEREVMVDEPKIIRVLLNILTNAIEAMPRGGNIKVSSRFDQIDTALFLSLSISDNGPGMDQKTLSQVFQPFFTTKPRGTGLGLAICKKIIDAHRGNISVESGVGQGTTVEITLPVRPL